METEKTNPTIEQLKKEMRTAEIINKIKQQERDIKQKKSTENPLERYHREKREKVNELLLKAKVRKVSLGEFGEHTERQFLVTIYPENTEFLACMQMLAEISKWFSVEPL